MDRGQTFLRAWTLLAVFVLLSSMLAWSAIAAKPVLAADPDHLAFTIDADASYKTTDTISVTVEVQDSGNAAVTDYSNPVHIALLNSTGPTLSGTVDVTPTSGDAQFSLGIHNPGTAFKLQATSGTMTAVDSAAFDVTPGNPNKLHFLDSDQPAGGTADQTFSTKVEVLDFYDNRVTTATNLVEFIPNPLVTIHGYAPTNAVNGVASFSGLGIYEAGTGYTLGASSSGLNGDVSAAFDITHGDAAKLVVSSDVDPSYTADQDIQPVVRIEDDHDNLVTDSNATVNLTLTGNGNGAVLLGGSAQASGGITEFSANVRKVGSGYGLDVSSGTLAGTSTGLFAITHAAAAKLVFSQQPTNKTADDTFTVKVDVQDQYDNLVDDAADNVSLSLAGPSTSLTGTTPVAASGGTATFNDLQVHKAGTGYTLKAESGSLTSATSSSFDIAHGDPTNLHVTQNPDPTYTADADITVKVEVRDQYHNRVTDGTGSNASIALALNPNPTSTTLSGSPATAVNGEATFTLNVRKVGTGYGLDATSGSYTGDSTTGFNITPGKLDSFVVTTTPATKVAGTSFTVSATAKDHWGNLKTDYNGPATLSGSLSTSLGLNTGNGDDNAPSYVSFSSALWSTGTRTTDTTGYVAESGTVTVTVTGAATFGGTATGTSASFTIDPEKPNNIFFSVPNNDVATFDFGPITTKVGTPIYHMCVPSGGSAPCATAGASVPSTAVRTLVRDVYGNPINGATVAITRNGQVPAMASVNTDSNGVADFGDSLVIGTVNSPNPPYTLTARVSSGTTHPTDTATVTIVNDLAACDNQLCQNNTNNAGGTKLQKSFGRITTTTDFFTGVTTNVLLSTQFVDGTQTNRTECGNTGSNKTIGNAVDMLVTGPGTAGTSPNSTMVLVMPKDTLKAFNITARGTETFNICLGAKFIGSGTPPLLGWKAKDPNSKKGALIQMQAGAEGRYWGTPANCGTAGLSASDPCIGLRTKQAATAQAYLGMTNAQFAQLGIKDSDLVVIIQKRSPWDGKGGLY